MRNIKNKNKTKNRVLVSLVQHFALSKAHFYVGLNMLLHRFGYDTVTNFYKEMIVLCQARLVETQVRGSQLQCEM